MTAADATLDRTNTLLRLIRLHLDGQNDVGLSGSTAEAPVKYPQQHAHGVRSAACGLNKSASGNVYIPMTEEAERPVGEASLDEIEAVYRRRFHDFRRFAKAVLRDPERAHEVVQDAFASAVRRRGAFRGEGSVESWLWSIVLNQARSAARSQRDVPMAVTVVSNGNPPDPEASAVRAALALLPERQRLAVFLRYYAGLEYAQIASVLGVERGTVSSTLHAAHAALRRSLAEVER